jgi:hypothetical protein
MKLSDKTGYPLPYCTVETPDIVCFSAFLSYRTMPLRRKNSFIGRPEIGITYGTLPVNTGHRIPQSLRPFAVKVSGMESDDFL